MNATNDKSNHWTNRLKAELQEAREQIAALERVRYDLQNPEIPVFATIYDGHACLNFADKGNERNRSLTGCMDIIELLARANRAPVFDISAASFGDIIRISELPLSERVNAWRALFMPEIERATILAASGIIILI